jgi:hypothetical protein
MSEDFLGGVEDIFPVGGGFERFLGGLIVSGRRRRDKKIKVKPGSDEYAVSPDLLNKDPDQSESDDSESDSEHPDSSDTSSSSDEVKSQASGKSSGKSHSSRSGKSSGKSRAESHAESKIVDAEFTLDSDQDAKSEASGGSRTNAQQIIQSIIEKTDLDGEEKTDPFNLTVETELKPTADQIIQAERKLRADNLLEPKSPASSKSKSTEKDHFAFDVSMYTKDEPQDEPQKEEQKPEAYGFAVEQFFEPEAPATGGSAKGLVEKTPTPEEKAQELKETNLVIDRLEEKGMAGPEAIEELKKQRDEKYSPKAKPAQEPPAQEPTTGGTDSFTALSSYLQGVI